jgi:hypothetical protein
MDYETSVWHVVVSYSNGNACLNEGFCLLETERLDRVLTLDEVNFQYHWSILGETLALHQALFRCL